MWIVDAFYHGNDVLFHILHAVFRRLSGCVRGNCALMITKKGRVAMISWLIRRHIMKKLISLEMDSPGEYASLTEADFYRPFDQFRVIRECKKLATEQGLVEWLNGDPTDLFLRVSPNGQHYFYELRKKWADRGVTFILGLLSGWLIALLTCS